MQVSNDDWNEPHTTSAAGLDDSASTDSMLVHRHHHPASTLSSHHQQAGHSQCSHAGGFSTQQATGDSGESGTTVPILESTAASLLSYNTVTPRLGSRPEEQLSPTSTIQL